MKGKFFKLYGNDKISLKSINILELIKQAGQACKAATTLLYERHLHTRSVSLARYVRDVPSSLLRKTPALIMYSRMIFKVCPAMF